MIKIESAFPLFVVDNLSAQKAFYSEAFGFEAVFFEPDLYLHLVNPANGIELGFMLSGLKTQPDFLRSRATSSGTVVTFEVADAARAYEQARRDGFDVVYELKVESWKQTHFMIRDPAGLIVDVVEDSNQVET